MLRRSPLKKNGKPLKKSPLKKRSTSAIQKIVAQTEEDIGRMWKIFLEIWEERKHPDGRNYSELSGEYLGKSPKSTFFDHALEKNYYPEFKFNKRNIILVTWYEHQNKDGPSEHENYKAKIQEIKKILL